MPPDPDDPVQRALNTVGSLGLPQSVEPGRPSYIGEPDPTRRSLTDQGLYSHAADVVGRMPQAKGTPAQFRAMLLKQGVKPDELKWSGYDEKLGNKSMVTRDELKRHFNRGLPAIRETVHREGDGGDDLERRENGTAQYGEYTLTGGKNYRELLLHTPTKNHVNDTMITSRAIELANSAGDSWGALGPNGRQRYQNAARRDLEINGADYRSSHWNDTPNVLAHIRMSDRPLAPPTMLTGYSVRNRASGNRSQLFKTEDEAKQYVKTLPVAIQSKVIVTPDEVRHPDSKRKALHVEELQSDWSQEGRQKGFQPAEGGVPHAPYVDSTGKWLDLALKRVLHEAAHGGHDRVLITPGDEQAKRYDLSQIVNRLHYSPDTHHLHAYDEHGAEVYGARHSPEELPSVIGHEISKKLLNAPVNVSNIDGRRYQRLHGDNMRVGGEGMKQFYDRLVPQALEKLSRKHDPEAKVQLHSHKLSGPRDKPHSRIRSTVAPLHSLEITPKMRESIKRGQPAYASGGAVGSAADSGVTRNTHPHPEGGRMHTYDTDSEADRFEKSRGRQLRDRKKTVKPTRTAPIVEHALRIAAEATR